MIRINLLGSEAEQKTKGLKGLSLPELSVGATQAGMGALFVSVLVIIAVAWWYQSSQLSTLRGDLAVVQEERSRLQEVADGVDQLRERSDQLRQRLQVIVELKAKQTGPVMLLDQVSRNLTDGMWLTRLELERGEVTIRGAALSEASVVEFLSNLQGSQYFADVFLRTLGDSDDGLAFLITFGFTPVGAGATQEAIAGQEAG